MKLRLVFFGLSPYRSVLEEMLLIRNGVLKNECRQTLILCEHFPVYTVGIRSKYLGAEEEQRIRNLGAEFIVTDRGGLITFHGPGQLVVYPIINLKNYKPSVKWYVSQIQESVIDCLKNYGINGSVDKCYPGVWVDLEKIAALGIRCKRFVTSHGLAINANVDLSWFSDIVPCGIEGRTVTSLSVLTKNNIAVKDLIPIYLKSFSRTFNVELDNYSHHSLQVFSR